MTRGQRGKLWANLSYTLTLMGVLVIILSGLNIFLQPGRAASDPTNTKSQPRSAATDNQIDSLQQRLILQPHDQDSYVLLGEAYLQKARETGDAGYYARGENALMKALDLDPKNARALSLMGSLALARHEFETAIEWARRSLEVNSRHAGAYGILGDAQLEQGQYQAAVESIQRMVDLKPNLDSYARVSHIRKLMGDVAGAMTAMTEAIAAGPPGSENTAWAQLQLGELYFESGRIEEAADQYETALREFPGYYLALARLGRARAAQGHPEEAVNLYQKAINIVPQPSIVAELGDLYARIGETELAQDQYDTVEFIAKLESFNQQIYNRELARFYADHEIKVEQALEMATGELTVRQDIYGYDTLAWALYRNGRLEEAADAIGHALHLNTQDAVLNYHAGKIFHGLGYRERAIEHLERSLELNPYFSIWQADDARNSLAELRREATPNNLRRAAQ